MPEFRHPNITATTPEGQLNQLKTYLFQLTNQLNYAVKSVENEEKTKGYTNILSSNQNGTEEKSAEEKAQNNFNEVKNLIIKSADIVNAYYDVISKKLEGEYSALAIDGDEYHEFKESTEQWREESSTHNTDYFKAVQTISKYLGKDVDENGQPIIPEGETLSEIRSDKFYIKTGWLETAENGNYIGGIELGQQSNDDTNEDRAFARFTTKRLSFYNSSGYEVAWFGDKNLHIRTATVEDWIDLVCEETDSESGKNYWKGYRLDSTNGLAFLWTEEEVIDE